MPSWRYYGRLAAAFSLLLAAGSLIAGFTPGIPNYSAVVWLRVVGSVAAVSSVGGLAMAGVFVIKDWFEWKRNKDRGSDD